MISTKLSREFLEEQLSKLTPKRYNQFVWWRRYEVRQTLSEKAPLYDKLANGDYEHSDYYYQAQMENYLLEDKISRYISISIVDKDRRKILTHFTWIL